MKMIHTLKTLSLTGLLVLASQAFAGQWQPFDAAAFKSAQTQGNTIVVDFHADWCATCQKQKPLLESLLQESGFKDVTGFVVNYDEADELKQQLQVQKQSTLIVFKGNQEVARSMGMTNKDAIRDMIQKGVMQTPAAATSHFHENLYN